MLDAKGFERRRKLAIYFGDLRKDSTYARNLSAAARAAGITPSYLHRIENGEVIASLQCYVDLCRLYGGDSTSVMVLLGRLDEATTVLVIDFLRKKPMGALVKLLKDAQEPPE